MKVRKKLMYDIVFWVFTALTLSCYGWAIYCLVRWIVGMF